MNNRDSIAFEIMKLHILSQSRVMYMNPFIRIVRFLTGKCIGPATIEINMKDIVEKSYEAADMIIDKQSKESK